VAPRTDNIRSALIGVVRHVFSFRGKPITRVSTKAWYGALESFAERLGALRAVEEKIVDPYGVFGVLYSTSFWNGFQTVS
jgi:hypothetical protein